MVNIKYCPESADQVRDLAHEGTDSNLKCNTRSCKVRRCCRSLETTPNSSLKQQSFSIRAIARVLNRSDSTTNREFQRNSTTGHYASAPAQQACRHRRLQARPIGKLHSEGVLFGAVEHYLRRRWSPEQIALASQRLYPKGHPYRMSH